MRSFIGSAVPPVLLTAFSWWNISVRTSKLSILPVLPALLMQSYALIVKRLYGQTFCQSIRSSTMRP